MLSERELRALQEIERSMRAETPDLAGSLTRMEPDHGRARLRHDAVIVLCALSMVLCIVVGAPGPAFTALLLGVAVVGVRRWRWPGERPRYVPRWARS